MKTRKSRLKQLRKDTVIHSVLNYADNLTCLDTWFMVTCVVIKDDFSIVRKQRTLFQTGVKHKK